MPTYQYACTECGERLEVVQKFTDDPLTVCPACEGRLRKLFSAVGVVFKGSGFYKTDSRGSSGGAKTGTAAKSGAESASGAEKTSGSEKTSAGESSASTSTAEPAKPASSGSSGDGTKVA